MAQTRTVTLLFCDLVGSTALMTRLGDDANDRIRRRFFVALREAVAANRGEEVKSAGDGMMVAFPSSAADAVSCAVAMQRAVSRLAAGDPLLGLAIRVGLSSGEASYENNDWFGVPVVEAARLEHAARPGQILCSELTRGLVGTRGGHTFTPVGALELKGLPEPLPACEVAWEPDPGLPAIPLPSGLVVGGLPFAGRLAEMATLHKAWDDAVAGERRYVAVSGERGIGKTRLAAEFAARIHGNGFVVLYGRSETDREVPFQPFAEALRWYVLAGQPQSLREQVGPAGGELTRIVPALRLRLPELPEPLAGDPASERQALFDAVLYTLRSVSERAGVLLVVDDLEQADEPTLALLRHLVTSPERQRLLVVGLAGEAVQGSPWAATGPALAALPGSISLPLAGLETVDIASLLERVEGAPPAPELAERIRRETDGSPRFVGELVARLQEAGGGPDAVIESACPYMGLRSFDTNDAALYFGRDEVIGSLLGRLGATRLLSVIGASGSGKSSLVRAGLIPRLRDGALPGSRDWEILVITPGAHPLAELAAVLGASSGMLAPAVLRELGAEPRSLDLLVRQALTSRPAHARLVLVADQFEELFTLCRDEAERQQFIDALLAAVGVPGGRTMAILAMRADFYGEAARYPGLAEALEVSHALLGPMREDDLRSAIERPAAVTGLRIEPGLTEHILRDVGDEPGSLPLLSHALLETWKRREGRTLTVAGYAAAGGVRGAIAQTAETVYASLEEPDRAIAHNLFVRLTELGEGTEDTRRRVSFSEVVPGGATGEGVRAVINRLADARLLTTSTDSVEVAHEALIREWPRLRNWLDDDREGLRVLRHLTESAQAWERLGRDDGELYRGTRLSAATEWFERTSPELNPLERDFFDASCALRERQEREARARLRRLRLLAAVASGLFVVAAVVGGIALLQWQSANDARDAADSARLRAETAATEAIIARLETDIPTLITSNRGLAFVLAAQANRLQPGPRTERLLNRVLGEDVRYLGSIWSSEGAVSGYAVSPDSRYVLTRANTGLIELHDVSSREVVATARTPALEEGSQRLGAWFTDDGKSVITLNTSEVAVWEVPSLRSSKRFPAGGDLLPQNITDGRRLAFYDGLNLQLMDLDDGSVSQPNVPPRLGPATWGAFDPSGHLFANPEVRGATAIYDGQTFEFLRNIPNATLDGLFFTEDGSFMSLRQGAGIQLWNPRTGELLGTYAAGVFSAIAPTAQAALATYVAQLGEKQNLLLSLPSMALVGRPYSLLVQTLPSPKVAGDHRRIYLGDPGQPVEHWDLAGAGLAGRFSELTGPGPVAAPPDGSWMVKQSPDGSWARWSLADLAPLGGSRSSVGPLPARKTYQNVLSWTPGPIVSADGRYFLTQHSDCPQVGCPGSVVAWETSTGLPVGEPVRTVNRPEVTTDVGLVRLAFHPDLPVFAMAEVGGQVRVFTIDGTEVRQQSALVSANVAVLGMGFLPSSVATSPTLAVWAGGYRNLLSLWDVSAAEGRQLALHAFDVRTWGITPGGDLFQGVGDDLQFFKLATLLPGGDATPYLSLPLLPPSSTSGVFDARMSPDGSVLALKGHTGDQVTLIDLERKAVIGTTFAAAEPNSVVAYLDRSSLVVSSDGETVVWDLATGQWSDKACAAAGRNLTEAEWARYFPGRDYEVTCDQWPAKPKP